MKHHNQIGNKWAEISKYLEGKKETKEFIPKFSYI